MRVLLTGANGFIGSHVGDELDKLGWEIMASHRSSSNLSNTIGFGSRVEWLSLDTADWQLKVVDFQPQVIIHCAWGGVKAEERNDIRVQLQNLQFLGELLDIAKKCQVEKFIGLGSQAEYGNINNVVDEQSPVKPDTAYGIVKNASYELIKHFCYSSSIKWYWLRLFSFYGEREPETWLIPSIVNKALKGDSIDTTLGEQQYTYMYVRDLAVAICKLSNSNIESALFVISANKLIRLRDLITTIRDMVNPNCQINYGALTYRPNQSMIVKGDSSKFVHLFGEIEQTNFEQRLRIVINEILLTKSGNSEGI